MSDLSAKGLTKIYNKRKVVNQIDLLIAPGESGRSAGAQWRRKNDDVLHDCGIGQAGCGRDLSRRENITGNPMYRRARKGLNYSASRTVDFPEADCGGKHPGDSGNS